jgi:DNA-binding transcriptional LysR family regulator
MRQFLIAAESGSFRVAAAGTLRSAAAVSTAMRDLELQVGAPLFEKGRHARLTPLGQALTPLFSELLRTHERVLRDVHQLARAEHGSLSIAVVPFLGDEWFPPVLCRFLNKYPQVGVRVTDERSFQVPELVADGLVDIGVAAYLAEDPKLEFQPVAVDTFGIICRHDDEMARRQEPVPWRALAGRKLIGNEGFETLANHGLGEWIGTPSVSVSSRVAMVDCVRQGIGISILPRLAKPPGAKDIAFVPLVEPEIPRLIGIVTRRGQTLLPAALKMLALIQHELREYAKSYGVKLYEPPLPLTAEPKRTRGRQRAQRRL